MKKWVMFLAFISITFSHLELQAVEKSKPTKGQAAVASTNQALKWSMFVAGTGLAGTVFGLIYELASSDPALFSHCHNCH
jgi:hypothetical protein